MTILANMLPAHGAALEPADAALVSPGSVARVMSFLETRPDYAPTPLLELPALAARLGVGALFVKDESGRLGLSSFKALGGTYAVIRLALDHAAETLGRDLGFADLAAPDVRGVTERLIFACATDGNHGAAVAFGARLAGAACTVFLHEGVSKARAAAILAFGASLEWIAGCYDDAVAEAASRSARLGWIEVADTARPGCERVPSMVMSGYTAILAESLRQLERPPTHLFVQAGVGGLAAILAAQLEALFGDARPIVVVVEPDRAACLAASIRAGRPVRIEEGSTIMAMLECFEPSLIAWRILSRTADFLMTVGDSDAASAMTCLARPTGGDPALAAGESGAAGLAGLMLTAATAEARARIGLDRDSRVLVVATEGATDPERYRRLVGIEPGDVGLA